MYFDGVWKWKYKAKSVKETGYEGIIKSLNIISVDNFKALPAQEQQRYVKEVISRIREVNVYPIYYYNDRGIFDEILKCMQAPVYFTGDALVEHGRAGLTLLDFMFPNLHRATAGNSVNNAMYDRFYDDEKLSKCLTRHMKNYTYTSMRTPFFMYGRFFWSTPTNFSPMRAKAIYKRFCQPGGTIYDFSAGFGGRLLGALSNVPQQFTYIGCEPCHDTAYNLNRLGQYIERMTKRTKSYTIHEACSEDLKLPANSIDFAFSCPPYFKLERYDDKCTQSYNKYPIYSDWLKHYVEPTLLNVHEALKPDCDMGFVVANYIHCSNIKYSLGADWCAVAQKCGFTFVKKYALKTMSRKTAENVECLYMFRKVI